MGWGEKWGEGSLGGGFQREHPALLSAQIKGFHCQAAEQGRERGGIYQIDGDDVANRGRGLELVSREEEAGAGVTGSGVLEHAHSLPSRWVGTMVSVLAKPCFVQRQCSCQSEQCGMM